MKSIFITLFLIFFHFASGQIQLEKDINLEPASSSPLKVVEVGGILYFPAEDGIHEREIYSYNTMTGEAALTIDLKIDEGNNTIEDIVAYNGRVYFSSAANGSTKYIHSYDPVTGEVEVLRDNENQRVRNPTSFFVFEGKLFYRTEKSNSQDNLQYYDANNGLFKTFENEEGVDRGILRHFNIIGDKLFYTALSADQTTSNIFYYETATDTIVRYDYDDPDGLYPFANKMTYFNGYLFFADNLIVNGGTRTKAINMATGQAMIFPQMTGAIAADAPLGFHKFEDKLYFSAKTKLSDRSLVVFDPETEEITIAFQSLPDGNSNPGGMMTLDGKMIFFGLGNSDDDPKGFLYSYDPIADNYSEIATLSTDSNFGELYPRIVHNDKVYLSGYTEETGRELWSYDPTNDELSLTVDINTNTASAMPTGLVEYNDGLYFSADEYRIGSNLWKYSATTGIAERVTSTEESNNARNMTELNGKLYFSGNHPTEGYGIQYYDSNTDQFGITSVRLTGCNGCLTEFINYGGKLYMSARLDDDIETELYAYDPDTDEINLIADINPTGSGWPRFPIVYDGELYFQAFEDGNNRLYRYNQDSDLLKLVEDIDTKEIITWPGNWTALKGELHFEGRGESGKYELFSYNPVTEKVVQRTSESSGMRPDHLVVYQDKIYFSGHPNNTIGRELHSLDPTTGEVKLELDLIPGNASSSLLWNNMHVFNNKLYFSHITDEYGSELWEYDGTTAEIIADINPSIKGSKPNQFTLFNNKLYFSADDGSTGEELWSFASCINASLTTTPQFASSLGSIDVNVTGGTPPYQYNWDNGTSDDDIVEIEEGVYSVVITDQSGCISILFADVGFNTATKSIESDQLLTYPNPTTDFFNVEYALGTKGTLYLYDTMGKLIQVTKISPTSDRVFFDMTDRNEGVYVVKLYGENGVMSGQVVKM